MIFAMIYRWGMRHGAVVEFKAVQYAQAIKQNHHHRNTQAEPLDLGRIFCDEMVEK